MAPTATIQFTLDEENQIIRSTIEGEINEESANEMRAAVIALKPRLHDPDHIRILSISQKSFKPGPPARRILMANIDNPDIYKMAIMGKNQYMHAVFSFFLMVTGSKKVKAFTNEGEAIAWLKQ